MRRRSEIVERVVPPGNHPTVPRDSDRGGAEGRAICETKRIRSHYLLLDGKQASRTLDATPLQGRASLAYYQ